MAKKYDDYGYEKNNYDGGDNIAKKILIVVMVLVAIVLIFVLIKGCNSTNKKPTTSTKKTGDDTAKPIDVVDTPSYETSLLIGGKAFFDNVVDANPRVPGACSIVELQTLINGNYVNAKDFEKCDTSKTYVKQCILESGAKQYTPWLGCSDNNSEDNYDTLVEGNLGSVISDSTYVEFRFLPQYLKKGGKQLGPKEELWKEDITYESYKTLATTKYYRYRDKLYTWNLYTKSYYSRDGIKSKASDVKDYYVSSPYTGYTSTSDKTDAYKWYRGTTTKEYYMENGSKKPSTTAVGDYTIKETPGIVVTRYRTISDPIRYYVCTPASNPKIYFYKTEPCPSGYNTYDDAYYSCGTGSKITEKHVSAGQKCYSEWTSTACDVTKPTVCQSATTTFYYWYKYVTTKKYYPSGSSTSGGEKVYYVTAPTSGLTKDTSTKATAYKWYKEESKTSGYSAVAPTGYSSVTKTSDYKYSDWSNWSTKNPTVKDGRERTIETKVKIKLQQYLGDLDDSWENLKINDYVTEEELIKIYKDNKYKVNSLEDISNNGEIKYQIKMFVRNKRR